MKVVVKSWLMRSGNSCALNKIDPAPVTNGSAPNKIDPAPDANGNVRGTKACVLHVIGYVVNKEG